MACGSHDFFGDFLRGFGDGWEVMPELSLPRRLLMQLHFAIAFRGFKNREARLRRGARPCAVVPVSYTHLDVYKRQVQSMAAIGR